VCHLTQSNSGHRREHKLSTLSIRSFGSFSNIQSTILSSISQPSRYYLNPERTEPASRARAPVLPLQSEALFVSIMGNTPPPAKSSTPRSTIVNFDISMPNDPHFQSHNLGPTSTAKADHEWKEERWYFVPPEVDSDGKPIFAEAGDPCGEEAAEGEGFTDGRSSKGEKHYERKT